MSTSTISQSIMTITPELAADFLKFNTNNRPLNSFTVEFYAQEMTKNQWKVNGSPIVFSDGNTLLDGQHRLAACVKAGVPFTTTVVKGVDPEVFDTIDVGRQRTPGDLLAIDEVKEPAGKASVIKSYFSLVRSEVSLPGDTSNVRLGFSKQELRKFYKDHKGLIEDAYSIASRCYTKLHLMPKSLIGGYALYLILEKKHSLELVNSFFMELYQFAPETNQTIGVLRDALIRHITKTRVLPPSLRHIYFVKAWNAYAKGKELKILSYDRFKEPNLRFI